MKTSYRSIVDVTQVNEFTEAHLELVRNNVLIDWKETYPELFVDVPGAPAIKFWDFMLMSHTEFEVTHQKHRAGGRTRKSKYTAIKQNIERNGYKLKYPAIAVFIWADGTVEIITGNSRTEILRSSPFNTINVIVAVYKEADGDWSNEQIRDSLDIAGSSFNSIHDPAEPVSPQDTFRSVSRAITRYADTDGEAGIPCTIDAITERVDYHLGEGVLQPSTRLQLVYEIYNNWTEDGKIISWSNAKDKDFNLNRYMKDSKFVDTDKVKWMVSSTDTESKGFVKAVKLASQNPGCEIRIMLHTGTLSGNSLEHTYKKRCGNFVNMFENVMRDVCLAYFDTENPAYNRIKIWGALPALGDHHDLSRPFIFNSRTRIFYQDSNDYEFDIS